jgi:hypothetical protein
LHVDTIEQWARKLADVLGNGCVIAAAFGAARSSISGAAPLEMLFKPVMDMAHRKRFDFDACRVA